MNAARLRVAQRLTLAIGVLALLAAGIGLWRPDVYRDTAWVIPQNRGQDLVTLLGVLWLLPLSTRASRGSPRATLLWLGLLGYLAYTYTGAAFAYAFNPLFPVYVALFSLCAAALIAALSAVDATALRKAFDARTPRRSVIAFLLLMALMLVLLWGSQIVPFYTAGRLPEMITKANVPTVFVYVLDLGVVVPLALLAAWWLRRDRPWGFVLASFILVKAATMGLALLSMTAFAWRAGVAADTTLTVAWVLLAGSATTLSFWYFTHCEKDAVS